MKELDDFGKFICKNLRDASLDKFINLKKGVYKDKELHRLQNDLKRFNDKDMEIIDELIKNIIDTALHDFLFSIEEEYDFENNIKIISYDKNIAEISDGLAGELYSEDGWIHKYSKY